MIVTNYEVSESKDDAARVESELTEDNDEVHPSIFDDNHKFDLRDTKVGQSFKLCW